MIALDTNILVYAHRPELPHNAAAFVLVKTLADAAVPWAIPWPCIYEFYGVVTNPRVWNTGATPGKVAREQIDFWLGSPSLHLLGEPDNFASTLYPFLVNLRVIGAKVHDARIAALCAAHGVSELLTADRDFALFPSLKTRNPFA